MANNPVVGTAPCDHRHCSETVTVHEVKRGGSTRRGQLYTRCPACGCDQTSGETRQKWLIENTTPRHEYAELFEFKKAAQAEPAGVSDDDQAKTTDNEKPENPDPAAVSGGKMPGAVVGIFGLVLVSGLALLGLKK